MVLFVRHGIPVRTFIEQVYAVGVRSLVTTIATGLFVGAIMAIQLNLQLKDFGAQGMLGGLATSVTMRNVGPVLIGFILSGKVGAFASAELGTMQVTDQLNAMRCLGTDPMRYLVAPRLAAVIFSSFLLLVIGLMMGVLGGMGIANVILGVNSLNYIENIPMFVDVSSVAIGVIKSFVFGAIIGTVGCYHGYFATGGAPGVGYAVRRTAVQSLVAIILTDYAISSVAVPLIEMWWGK